MLATTMLFSCKSKQEQLHDEFIAMCIDEELNGDALRIAKIEGQIEILEYIAAIKDNSELTKAIDYMWGYSEERMEWRDELTDFRDEELREAYNLEEQAETFEDQIDRRADRLDL